ncbi:hypothetical protein FLACOL7796_04706 [Flavobacterium collinsii]|uniref:Outer membrane efflux protein n=1 Tax=Flavobacterium collinsii TaxID=1114861 RepID=A0ABN7ERX7_9FLAO|nr:hypothetical protein FLACOL7796_04706 [Flavobacterium collinsii]
MCNIFFIIFSHCYSQQTDSIYKNYNKIETKKIDSVIKKYAEKDKLKYLSILPNFSYNLRQNVFNVGISLSNLSTYYQTKKRNEIEIEKLHFQLIEKKNNSIEKFTNEYEQIIDSYEILRLELDNKKLSEEIFNLKKSQYENNKITLETWLTIQDNYQKTNIVIVGKYRNIISKMKQFELKIKNSCFDQEFKYLSINVPNQ